MTVKIIKIQEAKDERDVGQEGAEQMTEPEPKDGGVDARLKIIMSMIISATHEQGRRERVAWLEDIEKAILADRADREKVLMKALQVQTLCTEMGDAVIPGLQKEISALKEKLGRAVEVIRPFVSTTYDAGKCLKATDDGRELIKEIESSGGAK